MKGEVALCHHNLTSAWLTNVFLFLRSVAFPWLCTPVVALCNFCQRGAPGLPLYRCSRYLLLSCNLLLKFIFTSINSVPSVSVNFLYLISLGQGVCIFFLYFFLCTLIFYLLFHGKRIKGFLFFCSTCWLTVPNILPKNWLHGPWGKHSVSPHHHCALEQAPSGSCSCLHSWTVQVLAYLTRLLLSGEHDERDIDFNNQCFQVHS